ncbi:2,4-dienoyl-CoA reductase [Bacillus sp. FJAT-50079]|uniref:2,4-dienoyl-CoA reductase n=1 Tax=Bacillus sp. FJAT-50079 TaxID=2833577 RepID=UPI001BCA5773|nr:2,4-dienoyl-CoA reductase [Bacillus sp. FJAT-50079]MBS4207800.1 2,4-dienoyl-CoA reductase [Bacillus sp. FJAT-50079]
MEGKTVIITGGSSGMGKYMAKKFANSGMNVVITGRNEQRLLEAKREISGESENVQIVQMDVRKPEDVKKMLEQAIAYFGSVHYLVNNAAGNFLVAAEKLSVNGWNSVIDIVLNGTFYCSRELGSYWIENQIKGKIINIVATYAWDAGAGIVHSAAAKAGVLSLTRTLAVEWGRKYRIQVNAIAPGAINRTGGVEKLAQSAEEIRRTVEGIPLGRLGEPEEIAELAYFMLSEKAAYMNGECITLDGGQWLNQLPF